MATGLVELIKKAALDANDNAQLTDLRYGTVVSEKPLKVRITDVFTVPESLLVVPEHLTDYEIEVTIKDIYDWKTRDKFGGSGEASFAEHNHDIVITKKKMLVHGKLKTGDKVALLRKQGGQSYYILDRLPKE